MAFTTYENRVNPHVQCIGTPAIILESMAGYTKMAKDHYKPHLTYKEAKTYAYGTKFPLLNCSSCNPQ